jgi:uncharacterized protein
MDAWTAPFWAATAERKLLLSRCGACLRFRWPPGPFCPTCHSQQLDWVPAGAARVFSYTLVRSVGANGEQRLIVPALIEFPECDGLRLPAAIVDTPEHAIGIGAPLLLAWSQARSAAVPVFIVDEATH